MFLCYMCRTERRRTTLAHATKLSDNRNGHGVGFTRRETPLHCQYPAIGEHRDVLTQGQAELDFSCKKPSTQDCQRTWIDWTLLHQGLLIQSENGHLLQRIRCRLPALFFLALDK